MRSESVRKRSAAGDALTEVVLKVFLLYGRFLAVAEEITEDTELTAARWQVLGAVLSRPLTVSDVARAMGLSRQAVQRQANVLVEDGLCAFHDNPEHKRAKLLAPTDRGWEGIARIRPIQIDWADRVGAAVGEGELLDALNTLERLVAVLGSDDGRVDPEAR